MPQDVFPVSKWKNRINLFPFFNRSFGNDLIDVLYSGGLRAWICGNCGTAFGARLPFFGYAGTAIGNRTPFLDHWVVYFVVRFGFIFTV